MFMPNLPPGSSTTVDGSEPRQDSHSHGTGQQWRRRVTRKLRKVFAGVMRRIFHPGRQLKTEEDCIRLIEVTRETVNRDYIDLVFARALFDTGCSANLVTQQWLRNHGMEHLVKPVSDENNYLIIRHHDVESGVTAEVEMEWYGRNEDRKDQIVFLKDCSLTDRFLVVPDTGFDIIIGRETIKRERLTTQRLGFYGDTQGGYSCAIQTPSDIEKSRQAGREKQRRQKEEQRAQRNQQSRGGSNNNNNGGNGSSPNST